MYAVARPTLRTSRERNTQMRTMYTCARAISAMSPGDNDHGSSMIIEGFGRAGLGSQPPPPLLLNHVHIHHHHYRDPVSKATLLRLGAVACEASVCVWAMRCCSRVVFLVIFGNLEAGS